MQDGILAASPTMHGTTESHSGCCPLEFLLYLVVDAVPKMLLILRKNHLVRDLTNDT